MKNKPLLRLLLILGTTFLVCKGDTYDINYSAYRYVPVFMSRSELERSVKYAGESRPIRETGKIYLYGDTILINEPYRGIHIIDNSDPHNPQQINYIIAPGCLDMAVNGNILYLDNAVDLVAFDMASGQVTERISDYFPERTEAPDYSTTVYSYDRPEHYILVRWDLVKH